jgi:hypothetical protein
MNKFLFSFLSIPLFLLACQEDDPEAPVTNQSCSKSSTLEELTTRNFEMGFSTWSFGTDLSDKDKTYQFIANNADVYAEQVDNKIPWKSWINSTSLPGTFTSDIADRAARRLPNHKLLLAVSLLNSERNDLLEDYDGSIPSYSALDDSIIENAYFKHLDYLITQLNPDYLLIAMEVNDLLIKSAGKWQAYQRLMTRIRSRLKRAYPNLLLSESITLHNWFQPNVNEPDTFIAEISSYLNQNMDFAAISFYPFFKGQHTKTEFQEAFDFLHSQTNLPIAFVETTHLAENLEVSSLNLSISSNACEQKDYAEMLLLNAFREDYAFIIWWAHRDYDKLWESLPPEQKDLGKLWRDTGLLNEEGNSRPAYTLWREVFQR